MLHEAIPEPSPGPQEQGRMLRSKAPKEDDSSWERRQLAHGLAWRVLITRAVSCHERAEGSVTCCTGVLPTHPAPGERSSRDEQRSQQQSQRYQVRQTQHEAPGEGCCTDPPAHFQAEMSRANKISSTFTGRLQNLPSLQCPEGPGGSLFGPPGHVSLRPPGTKQRRRGESP